MSVMPCVSLSTKNKKIVVRLTEESKKSFPITPEGARQVAHYVDNSGAEQFLHSSDLDHYEEFGINFDVLEVIREEWVKIRGGKPWGLWVQVVTQSGETLTFGRDDTRTSFNTEEEQLGCANSLTKMPEYKRIYLVTAYVNGQIKLLEGITDGN